MKRSCFISNDKIFLILVYFLSVLAINVSANPSLVFSDTIDNEQVANPLFASDEILDISIHFDDLKKLKRDVSDEASYHKACLEVENIEGRSFFNIKVKTRGIFRKDPSNCNFPPLKLDFRKSELENSLFDGQNKLKLVTHCRSGDSEYEQYVIQEYLAYKIYNILTEKSFNVRLARVNYIDISGKCKDLTRFAFFIEDVDDVARRNGYTHVNLKNIPQNYTDYFCEGLLAVYQYMIGNIDWSVPGAHNIKLMLEKPDHRPVPIPYDFDFSGIVDPVYAVPNAKYGIDFVGERLFRGYERPEEDFQRIFDYILTKQEAIMKLYENSPLSEKQKERAVDYLDEFFSIISNEDLIYTEFILAGRKHDLALP